MSASEKQKSAREAQPTMSTSISPANCRVIEGDSISRDPNLAGDGHVARTLDISPLQNSRQGCEKASERNVVIDLEDGLRLSSVLQTVLSNSQSGASAGEVSKPGDNSGDSNMSTMQGFSHTTPAPPPSQCDEVSIVKEVRKDSNQQDDSEISQTSREMEAITQVINQPADASGGKEATVAGLSTTSNLQTVKAGEDTSLGTNLQPNQEINTRQTRPENLPRLALLDLPLVGIGPSSQDTNELPKMLEKIQGSPLADPCNLRSLSSLNRDPQRTGHISPSRALSAELPGHQSLPLPTVPPVEEPALNSKNLSNAKDDDDIIFVMSIPKKGPKKRKRMDYLAGTAAHEPANSLGIQALFSPKPRQQTCVIGPSFSHVTTKNVPTGRLHGNLTRVSEAPVSQGSSFPAQQRVSTGSAQTTLLVASDANTTSQERQVSPTDCSTDFERSAASSCNVEDSARGMEQEILQEAPKTSELKRKVHQVTSDEGEEDPSTGHVKRAKIQNGSQSRSESSDQSKDASTKVLSQAATLRRTKTPGFPSLNVSTYGFRSPTNNSTAINSTQQSSQISPNNGALHDLRRHPSLYSIPSWSSTQPTSDSASNQRRRSSVKSKNQGAPVSQRSQNSNSLDSRVGPSFASYNLQSCGSDNPRTSSTIADARLFRSNFLPPNTRGLDSSRVYALQQQLDQHNRLGNQASGYPVYGYGQVPTYMRTGQYIQRDGARARQITLTPQEYTRALQAQFAKSGRNGTSSPQQAAGAESTGASETERTVPKNLLVDIAQTCQANFPFEQVAQRHNLPIKKVMDTFSAIIQIPMLASGAGSRTNSKLGNERMKEFRELSKAVTETHKKEKKSEQKEKKSEQKEKEKAAEKKDDAAPPPVKRGKGRPKGTTAKGLLEKAIANNSKKASG